VEQLKSFFGEIQNKVQTRLDIGGHHRAVTAPPSCVRHIRFYLSTQRRSHGYKPITKAWRTETDSGAARRRWTTSGRKSPAWQNWNGRWAEETPSEPHRGSQRGRSRLNQTDFFPTLNAKKPTIEVPGFSLVREYTSPEEERVLLGHIETGPWETDWRRRIQQYGLGYSETGVRPTWLRDFPDWLVQLAARVQRDAHLERFPENCVINEYIPPLGIGPHKDYPAFGPTIACISLGSAVILDLMTPDRATRVSADVPARSLWVMTGEARSRWLHTIAARLNDVVRGERRKRQRRVSITFRTATMVQ
jgi:alkylated DNA repair dioxygenase AlkB